MTKNHSTISIDHRNLKRILYEKASFQAVPTHFQLEGSDILHPVQFVENPLLATILFSDGTTHYVNGHGLPDRTMPQAGEYLVSAFEHMDSELNKPSDTEQEVTRQGIDKFHEDIIRKYHDQDTEDESRDVFADAITSELADERTAFSSTLRHQTIDPNLYYHSDSSVTSMTQPKPDDDNPNNDLPEPASTQTIDDSIASFLGGANKTE